MEKICIRWLRVSISFRVYLIFHLLTTISAFSIHADISNSLADVFNLHCFCVMHRPKFTDHQTKLAEWFKDVHSKSRGMGFIYSDLGVPRGDHYRCLHIVMSEQSSPEKFANVRLRKKNTYKNNNYISSLLLQNSIEHTGWCSSTKTWKIFSNTQTCHSQWICWQCELWATPVQKSTIFTAWSKTSRSV